MRRNSADRKTALESPQGAVPRPSSTGSRAPAMNGLRRACAGYSIGGASILRDCPQPDRSVGRAPGNARVDHVDHPADRRRTEQQGGRTAQHLYSLGGDGVDRNCVIGTGRRKVERADALRQDPDPITGKAAKDGGRGDRTEASGGDAGEPRQGFADTRPKLAAQLGFVENRHAAEDVLLAPADPGDNDRSMWIGVNLFCGARRRLFRSDARVR